MGGIHVQSILGVSGLNIAPCLSSGAGVELKIDGRASGGRGGEDAVSSSGDCDEGSDDEMPHCPWLSIFREGGRRDSVLGCNTDPEG